MRDFRRGVTVLVLIGLAVVVPVAQRSPARSANGVTPGALIVEPPTLISLGFEWRIQGDANRNAAVAVEYRRAGDAAWRQGLPLLRLNGERSVYRETLDYAAPNQFAGSLFDLDENTAYEARFTLTDPDGVAGGAQRVVTVRTRPEPQVPTGGRTFHVYPDGFTGTRQAPAFVGLLAAYYTEGLGGDWSRASPPRVRPGDVIRVHAALYKDDRTNYSHEIQQQFQVMGADHLYFEGITFRNTTTAIEAGQKGIAGAKGLTVKRSRFEDVGVGIHSDYSGTKNFYIADNVMIGRNDPGELFGWLNQWPWNTQPESIAAGG